MLESGIAETFKRKLFCHARGYTTTFDCLLNVSLSGHRGQKSLGRICCNVPGRLQYCSGKQESLRHTRVNISINSGHTDEKRNSIPLSFALNEWVSNA